MSKRTVLVAFVDNAVAVSFECPVPSDRLFTPRFFLMCGFTFTVFLAAFQIYPTAPFRILALGGDESVAGMFLGLLTYASAVAAPFTGALADRVGKRRVLVVSSVAAALFSAAYAVTTSVTVLLTLAASMASSGRRCSPPRARTWPTSSRPHRRAEGMGYYGLATVLAIAVAPTLGLGDLPLRLGRCLPQRRRRST